MIKADECGYVAPFKVVPAHAPWFNVTDQNDRAVVLATSEGSAHDMCDELNEKGFIEDHAPVWP